MLIEERNPPTLGSEGMGDGIRNESFQRNAPHFGIGHVETPRATKGVPIGQLEAFLLGNPLTLRPEPLQPLVLVKSPSVNWSSKPIAADSREKISKSLLASPRGSKSLDM